MSCKVMARAKGSSDEWEEFTGNFPSQSKAKAHMRENWKQASDGAEFGLFEKRWCFVGLLNEEDAK